MTDPDRIVIDEFPTRPGTKTAQEAFSLSGLHARYH